MPPPPDAGTGVHHSRYREVSRMPLPPGARYRRAPQQVPGRRPASAGAVRMKTRGLAGRTAAGRPVPVPTFFAWRPSQHPTLNPPRRTS
jgi:hypothetical protein